MASTKDDLLDARPSSQSRPSSMHLSARPHAHSVSLGALNANHRVNRRKSSSSMAGVNMPAVVAAAKDPSMDGLSTSARIKAEINGSIAESTSVSAGRPKSSAAKGSSAVVDGPPLSTMMSDKSKARARRASEGSRLARGERRKSNAGELRCEKCGKGYKHGSCLTKHLWEHTPEWSLTSKLLISKHQQVQLLEAASVLMTMNKNGTDTEVAIQESESSGESPAASGSSDPHEDEESSRTSTPSQDAIHQYQSIPPKNRPSRQDSYNSAFSRSYASTSAHSFAASSAPTETDLYWYRSSAGRRRPSTSSQSHYSSDEHADVAAAAEGLVSCSLGTPKHGPAQDDDVPPVPPLPAQYAHQASRPVSFTKAYQHDIEMMEVPERDEEDEGVFGHMER